MNLPAGLSTIFLASSLKGTEQVIVTSDVEVLSGVKKKSIQVEKSRTSDLHYFQISNITCSSNQFTGLCMYIVYAKTHALCT